jgi:hypothetical protein
LRSIRPLRSAAIARARLATIRHISRSASAPSTECVKRGCRRSKRFFPLN